MTTFDTNIKANKVLENRNSILGVDSYEETIIMNALKSKVVKRNEELSLNNNTEIEFKFDDDFEAVPKYEDMIDTKRNMFFKQSQHWIGVVEQIDGDEFTAKLEDKVTKGTYEIASFDIYDVSPSDIELLNKGAIFYWSVGYASDNGQIEKRSLLRFKRSVAFTEDDVNRIADEAAYYNDNINWE
ncbi:hypothetical protein K5X82_09995 [Halosquirtibacter xylanolyticus]|uniref:hypothetical protein n=1 Tax=Halosquirtibacter xylanolyticus TaxID=3374599 RepID=UPI00374A95D5|nr:hypothetical protein K5X82_09995 [Prolixibacteraceae bacterium]